METARSSETPVIIYQTTQRHTPENRNLYCHRRESLKSRNPEPIKSLFIASRVATPYLNSSDRISIASNDGWRTQGHNDECFSGDGHLEFVNKHLSNFAKQ
jgi:hypothetical protein